uniref:Ig-like domain-containing protein n=1 Tax=Cynoglossus semilaevis TaxID=244447 RepID=A0A3P8VT45_CYNSE
ASERCESKGEECCPAQLQVFSLPPVFTQKLKGQEAMEGDNISMTCELSKPEIPVEWKKGSQVLRSGQKYQIKQKGSLLELIINDVTPEDSGDYSCVCGDQKTTANLKVKGTGDISTQPIYVSSKHMKPCQQLPLTNTCTGRKKWKVTFR